MEVTNKTYRSDAAKKMAEQKKLAAQKNQQRDSKKFKSGSNVHMGGSRGQSGQPKPMTQRAKMLYVGRQTGGPLEARGSPKPKATDIGRSDLLHVQAANQTFQSPGASAGNREGARRQSRLGFDVRPSRPCPLEHGGERGGPRDASR